MGDISKNFSMDEFIHSDTAKNRKINNIPPIYAQENIKKLVINVLQPLRNYMGVRCTINSGYRCSELNIAVKGARNSRHIQGTAADINFGSKELNKKAYLWIMSNCKFRQLIDEKDFTWIHIEYDESDNKGQVLAIM